MGFSKRGTPLKYGVRKSPRRNICRVASANRGSSGSDRLVLPSPAIVVNAQTATITR
jgi:hypothetical protein